MADNGPRAYKNAARHSIRADSSMPNQMYIVTEARKFTGTPVLRAKSMTIWLVKNMAPKLNAKSTDNGNVLFTGNSRSYLANTSGNIAQVRAERTAASTAPWAIMSFENLRSIRWRATIRGRRKLLRRKCATFCGIQITPRARRIIIPMMEIMLRIDMEINSGKTFLKPWASVAPAETNHT